MNNQRVREVELLPSDDVKRRADTSGHTAAELINTLQKRGITDSDPSVESSK